MTLFTVVDNGGKLMIGLNGLFTVLRLMMKRKLIPKSSFFKSSMIDFFVYHTVEK